MKNLTLRNLAELNSLICPRYWPALFKMKLSLVSQMNSFSLISPRVISGSASQIGTWQRAVIKKRWSKQIADQISIVKSITNQCMKVQKLSSESRPYNCHRALDHNQPPHSPAPKLSEATRMSFHQVGLLCTSPENKHHKRTHTHNSRTPDNTHHKHK